MVERKIIWYMSSEQAPERHNYNFLIINEPREIKQIKQKLYEQLRPIEERTIEQGIVRGLHFELFTLETAVQKIDFSKVYRGKVRFDRQLQPRKSANGWFDFVGKIAEGKI